MAANETIRMVQDALGPYVKTRDEVQYIRRIISAHISSQLAEDSTLDLGPLALAKKSAAQFSAESRGLHKEYLLALESNIKAARDLESIRLETAPGNTVHDNAQLLALGNGLEDRLACSKLRKKQQRLQVVGKYLDKLAQDPAADPEFFNLETMLKESNPLPEVPRSVVHSIGLESEAGMTNIAELSNKLERTILQARLLQKHEEKLLAEVRARVTQRSQHEGEAARSHALGVTRAELIAWMEQELGKASAEGSDDEDSLAPESARDNGKYIDDQLATIHDKYAQYIGARQKLLQLVDQRAAPILEPPSKPEKTALDSLTVQAPKPAPVNHLLTPYLESLLSIAGEQKGLITQKAHVNVALSKQSKEACRTLDQLVDESQLLPTHPMPSSIRRKMGAIHGLGGVSEKSSVSSHTKAWVYAADAAKIATLEAVAEKIEEGQMALESSMRVLGDVGKVLGKEQPVERHDGEITEEEDLWLVPSQDGPSTDGALRRNGLMKPAKKDSGKDESVWGLLDGKMGLIRGDGHSK